MHNSFIFFFHENQELAFILLPIGKKGGHGVHALFLCLLF